MKYILKCALALGLGVLATTACAEVIGNAGAKKLEREAVALFQTKEIDVLAGRAFLQRNHFSVDDVNWKRVGQVIHGPYYIPDGEEEGDGVPYVFAYNEREAVVGLGGWLPDSLVKKLQALPTVKCSRQPTHSYGVIWMCERKSTTPAAARIFFRDLIKMAENAN